MKKNILVTGYPKSGKTTLIKKVIENYPNKIAGFYTEEILSTKGIRVGFRVITISSNEPGILAHTNNKTGWKVGKYYVNLHDFEQVVLPELDIKSELLVIDEIGKMELFSEKFKVKLLKCLEIGNVLATITMKGGGEFVKQIKNREDSELYYITERNRTKITKIIQEKIVEKTD